MAKNIERVTIRDAYTLFRNFAGEEQQYNRKGDRNFCVVLGADLARQMVDAGWNVKTLRSRDEDEPDRPYVEVAVGFSGNRPPTVVLVTSRGRNTLTEDEVDVLDWIDWKKADLILNPYPWSFNGRSGVKAYLKSLFVTADEDELMQEYADIPEIGAGPVRRELEAPQEIPKNVISGEVVYDRELEA